MTSKEIIELLPYDEPFLFVDEIVKIDKNGVVGTYKFTADSYFYKGHFKDRPITPGVLIVECMAQIGVGCLGIYHFNDAERVRNTNVALVSSEIEYLAPSFPDDVVTVTSKMKYFRFNKMKCHVEAVNQDGIVLSKGTISGIFYPKENE